MPGVIDAIKGFLTGDPIKSVTDLIAQFHASPEMKAQLEQAAQKMELEREQIEAARDQALAEVQGQNIRAETTSEDAYVRRARPTFLYMMILAMGVDLIIFPLINLFSGKGLTILEIPAPYLELFGAAFLGYTGARTWEKVKGAGKQERS